jgi:2-haloacid dehalogenase
VGPRAGGGTVSRWATFDCYGTLVDWEAGMRAALGAEALVAAYHEAERELEAEERFRPYREVLAEGVRRTGAAVDDQVLARTMSGWPVFDDVGPALRRLLDDGWRLGILSNVDRDLIAGTLERLPVAIELVVTAEDVRSYKPAPAHFEAFAAQTPDRTAWVHVACSLRHDIAPAAALGIPNVYIARGDFLTSADVVPDQTLPDLTALPELLTRSR